MKQRNCAPTAHIFVSVSSEAGCVLPWLLLMAMTVRSWRFLPFGTGRCWLLWFYTSLALRENVLRLNGSSIRKWWIRHHYYSMLLALTARRACSHRALPRLRPGPVHCTRRHHHADDPS